MVTKPQYGASYQRRRRRLLEVEPWCRYCGATATVADHVPPVALHAHVVGDEADCCVLVPSCKGCSDQQGAGVSEVANRLRRAARAVVLADLEHAGLAATAPCWQAPWVAEHLPIPRGSTWPRFMSAPHAEAVGSYGAEVTASAAEHGVKLRWWQRLVLGRLLEHDADGGLCWSEAIISTPRRSGKSWLLRELAWWRLTAARLRFGEPQTILHTSSTLLVTADVARPALERAVDLGEYKGFKVVRALGRERITTRHDDRWLVLAAPSVYGLGAGLAIADEAWSYPADVIVEGVQPTMIERASPQLLLVSTAHRRATRLIPDRRRAALAELEAPERRLLLEWSAPTPADPDDLLEAARLASPQWDKARRRLVANAISDARAEPARPGDVDPLDMVASQYLNDWQAGRIIGAGKGEPLLEQATWQAVRSEHRGSVAVAAVEDFYGTGYAVAWASTDDDSLDVVLGGRIVADSLELREALLDLAAVEVVAGASIAEDAVFAGFAADAVGQRETRPALSGLRRGVAEGRVFHDGSPDLSSQVAEVRLVAQSGGLGIVAGHRSDVLRAAAWCLARIEANRLVGPAVY